MEFHAFVQAVLTGFGYGEIATLQNIVKGYGCGLPADHSNAAGFLRLVSVLGEFRYRINTGGKVIYLNLAAVFRLNGFINAIALHMEIDSVHLAVLGGFHDFGGAVGCLHF